MHEVVSSILTFSILFLRRSSEIDFHFILLGILPPQKSTLYRHRHIMTKPSSSGGTGAAGSGGSQTTADPMSQYLSALPSPSSAGAAASSIRAIIHQALTNPKVLAGFSELRAHPAVTAALDKSGSGAGDDPALRTLDLFANGTHKDYAGAPPGTYLSLTDGQLSKLRQLTVVSVAQSIASEAAAAASAAAGGKMTKKKKSKPSKGKEGAAAGNATTVPYDLLRTELGLDGAGTTDGNVRDLEDILISCLYSGLISGRLDQHSMSLWIEPNPDHPGQPPVAARDVTKADVPRLIVELERFQKRSLNVLAALEGAAKQAREGREADALAVLNEEVKVMTAREQAEKKMRDAIPGGIDDEQGWAIAAAHASLGGGGGGGPAAMDLSAFEGGGRSIGSIARRQTKRSRAAGGGEGRF